MWWASAEALYACPLLTHPAGAFAARRALRCPHHPRSQVGWLEGSWSTKSDVFSLGLFDEK